MNFTNKKEGRGSVLLKHPSREREWGVTAPIGVTRPPTSRAIKSDGQKSACMSYTLRSENLACFPCTGVWERVGPSPTMNFFLQRRQLSKTLLGYLSSLFNAFNSAF